MDERLLALRHRGVGARQREAVLSDPTFPTSDVLHLLDGMQDDHDLILAFTVDASVLECWSLNRDPGIRAVVAFNPATPPATVEALVQDPHPTVRENAAFNPHLSRASRVRLAQHDPDPNVRDQATWAMRTRIGRAIAAGLRWVGLDGGDEEFRLVCAPTGSPRGDGD